MRLGRNNLAIVAVFMLVFVSVGAWWVSQSEAAGSGCVSITFIEYQHWGSTCVKNFQRILTLDGYGPLCNMSAFAYANQCDGDFGPRTEAAVRSYQYAVGIGASGNGQVGYRTWYHLCQDAYYMQPRDWYDFSWASCGSIY
jgi:hypothetical protein